MNNDRMAFGMCAPHVLLNFDEDFRAVPASHHACTFAISR